MLLILQYAGIRPIVRTFVNAGAHPNITMIVPVVRLALLIALYN